MKRVSIFLSVFFMVLVIGYLEPVFFPEEKQKIKIQEKTPALRTTLPYEKIQSTGYSTYINAFSSVFVDEFGLPTEVFATEFDYELWIYTEETTGYLEINVKNEKIIAIKALSNVEKLAPFHMGMTLNDVSDKMTIYSNFDFTYQGNKFDLELMEEDMNYRPLIAFDNDTFALLLFNHETEKLFAIVYASKEYLLTVIPYQLIEGEALPIVSENLDTEQKMIIHIEKMIDLLRKSEKLPSYQVSIESINNAQLLLSAFEQNAVKIVGPERAEVWLTSQEISSADTPFILTTEEYQKLLKHEKLEKKVKTGILAYPVYDPTFSVLTWFSEAVYYRQFTHTEKETIGIAIHSGSMLVLIQESEKYHDQIKDSD